jgi:hypothetical protein
MMMAHRLHQSLTAMSAATPVSYMAGCARFARYASACMRSHLGSAKALLEFERQTRFNLTN